MMEQRDDAGGAAVGLGEAAGPADEHLDEGALDALVAQYLVQGSLDASEDSVCGLRAAFSAGTALRALEPIEVYDPIARATVRVPAHAVLTVATHEGDVMVGELSDNSHSLGVLYEEAHRWYKRRYFLPLSTLVDRERVRIEEGAAAAIEPPGGRVRGLDADAHAQDVAVAVRRIEELALHDDTSLLPRGTVLVLREGATGRDPQSGEPVRLPAGAEVEVVAAMGDFAGSGSSAQLEAELAALEPIAECGGDPAAGGASSAPERVPDDVIRVSVGGRVVDLPSELLGALDPERDVLTWRDLEQRRLAQASRRHFLKLAWAGGLGVAFAGLTTAHVIKRRDALEERARHRPPPPPGLLGPPPGEETRVAFREAYRFVVPEVAGIYGLLTSGDKYWFDVKGALMDLRRAGSLDAVRTLAEVTGPTGLALETIWSAYRSSYYRSVHVGWQEHRHYRTDKDGRRHYTHSTWTKIHRWMWVEPGHLTGFRDVLGGWRRAAAVYAMKSQRLMQNPLFDLLSADPEDAEATFHLHRIDLCAKRDMAVSAFWMALAAAPPSFLASVVARERPHTADRVPAQREGAMTIGLGLGVLAERTYARGLTRTLEQNKYDLGTALEREVARVPTLTLDQAFAEYFVGRPYAAWPQDVAGWSAGIRDLAFQATDHVYVYGGGWSFGRSLDPCYVSGAAVRSVAPAVADSVWHGHLAAQRYVEVPQHADALLPVLRNAVGTELLRKQMEDDERQARSGNWKRALWFSAPLWGMALIDLALRRR